MKELFLQEALNQAEVALSYGEVPVGAIIVKDNKIIGTGFNNKENSLLPIGHAEIMAINSACQNIQSWRLDEATIYVTLEPCLMCLGALIHARIKRIVFGAKDPKSGVLGGMCNILNISGFNHYPEVEYVEYPACSKILKDFFSNKRKEKKGDIYGI